MVGVGGQPAIDQALHGPGPAQRARDEVPATLRVEVGQRPRIVGVADPRGGDLGLDIGRADLDPLDLGDLRQDEQRLDPTLGSWPELGVQIGLGLGHRLEIGLLGDPLPGEARPELVVEDLDLLVDEDVRQLDGRVCHGVLDDPVGEAVPGAIEGVALEPDGDLGAQRVEIGERAHRPGELVVEVGQDLLAQLLELDREMGRLAGQGGLPVVLREVDVELGRATHRQADEVGLEARDQAFLAEDERHPLGRATVERDAVLGADEADHRVVAVLGRPIVDRPERGVLVAQLVDHRLDLGVVDRLDLGREVERLVVAEDDLRRDLDRGRELERLAELGLDDVDAGLGERHDALFLERVAVGVLEEDVDRLVEDGRRSEDPLEHEPGRLAGPEAGDLGPPGQAPHGLVHRLVEALGRQLDLEEHGRLRGG